MRQLRLHLLIFRRNSGLTLLGVCISPAALTAQTPAMRLGSIY